MRIALIRRVRVLALLCCVTGCATEAPPENTAEGDLGSAGGTAFSGFGSGGVAGTEVPAGGGSAPEAGGSFTGSGGSPVASGSGGSSTGSGGASPYGTGGATTGAGGAACIPFFPCGTGGVATGSGGTSGGGGMSGGGGVGGADQCANEICWDIFDCFIFHPNAGTCGFTKCEGFVCKP